MHRCSYLLLDGTPPGEEHLTPIFTLLHNTLTASGATVQTLTLRNLKLGHCVGCFGCWLKTPGQCIQPDAGREIVQAILHSDTTVLFGPVRFGTYSPDLKRLMDRCLSCLNLPYLQVSHGETHHQPRYDRYPRLIGVGVQRTPDPGEAALFQLIVGRNALQFHAPNHAVSVITLSDSPEVLQHEFQGLLTRTDPLPWFKTLKALHSELRPVSAGTSSATSARQALLLIGSPKAKPSTSAALGAYLMERLEVHGWRSETLRLRARLRDPDAQAELLKAVERSDLIVLASPLYNDSLPYLVLYAMQLIAARRSTQVHAKPQRLVMIANNGFPEPHHNLPAIAVGRRFAEECGLDWAGGLIVGGGEALSAGQLLPKIKRILPPVKHVMRALDLAAQSLAGGKAVPPEAMRLISRNPISPAPFASYRWIFRRVAARRWEREAGANGLTPALLLAQPYQTISPAVEDNRST